MFFAATTDSRSWRGQVIEAERRAAQPGAAARTWVFQFDWRTPVDSGKWGAHHGLDVPFVFDNPISCPKSSAPEACAARLAAQISHAWIEFARHGNPNRCGIPRWPVYDLARRSTMVFDDVTRVVDDPRGDERRYSTVPMSSQALRPSVA